MLSRLAENLYWHGRYLERAEDLARLVNVNAHLHLDLPAGVETAWEPLVRITDSKELFRELHGDQSGERVVMRFLLGDARNPNSVRRCLAAARENLRTVRELLPREVWEQMNRLHLEADEQLARVLSKRRRHEFLRELVVACQTIQGTMLGCMSQDHPSTFILLGRYLERADMTTRILDVRADDLLPADLEELPPYESIQWMSVLKSLNAYQMYRRHVRLRVNGADVLRFLLRDPHFPRSVMYCLATLESLLRSLPGEDDRALRAVTRLMRRINDRRMGAIALRPRDASEDRPVRPGDPAAEERLAGPHAAPPKPLSRAMDELQRELAGLAGAIHATWFLQPEPSAAAGEE